MVAPLKLYNPIRNQEDADSEKRLFRGLTGVLQLLPSYPLNLLILMSQRQQPFNHRPTMQLALLNPNPKRTVMKPLLNRNRELRKLEWLRIMRRWRNQHRNWNTLARRK